MIQDDLIKTWKEFAEATDQATEAIWELIRVTQELRDMQKRKAQWWRKKERKFKVRSK